MLIKQNPINAKKSSKFKHNPKSKKSDQIATITHSGLCHRCSDKIAWKKKYRKYKPLKRSGKCYMCEQRTVKRAYHTICAQCSLDHHCCAWCKLDFNQRGSGGVVVSREERVELAQAESAAGAAEGALTKRKPGCRV